MEIELKLINKDLNIHIFERYSIESFKILLKNDPTSLLNRINELESRMKPTSTGSFLERNNDYVPFYPPGC